MIEGLSAEALGIDEIAEFVLWVSLWCGRDSFVELSPHGLLQFVMHGGSPFLAWGAEYRPVLAAGKVVDRTGVGRLEDLSGVSQSADCLQDKRSSRYSEAPIDAT